MINKNFYYLVFAVLGLLAFYSYKKIYERDIENTNSVVSKNDPSYTNKETGYSYLGADQGNKLFDKHVQNDTNAQLIEPSRCGDDPNGFTYFQIGEEVFRYKEESAIKVHRVDLNSKLRKEKSLHTDGVSEGCEGNPYSGVWLIYSYKGSDEEYKKLNLKKLVLIDVSSEKQSEVSFGQILHEDSYQRFKDNNKPCEYISTDLEKCVWPREGDKKYWSRVYRANNHKSLNRSFYLNCSRFVGDLECETYYRLYETVNFNYSFYLVENKSWNDRNVVDFDRNLRNIFESMRIVDVN